MFHIHYGIFYQQPNLENLYVGEDYLQFKAPLGGYYYAFGNPNLKPEQTTAYEVGLVHQLGDHGSLDVTVYYKAVKNLVEVTTIPSNPAAFSSFRNRDFGTIKGADISAKMRRTGRLMASVSYSLSYSSGTGSSPDTQRNIAWGFQPGVTEPPKVTAPLSFDQRHSVSDNLDYRFASNDGPKLMGGYPLSNAGINVLLKSGSGFPYTPTTVYNAVTLANVAQQPTGSINSSYGPWNFQIDAKANKAFQFGRINGNLYVWAINLLDRTNLSSRNDREARGIESTVYAGTGSAETTGWLNTASGRNFVARFGDLGRQKFELKEQDPQNFATPRQVRFGLALNF